MKNKSLRALNNAAFFENSEFSIILSQFSGADRFARAIPSNETTNSMSRAMDKLFSLVRLCLRLSAMRWKRLPAELPFGSVGEMRDFGHTPKFGNCCH